MIESADLVEKVILEVEGVPIDRIDEVTDILATAGFDVRQRFLSSRTRISMRDSIGGIERF